MKTLLSITLCLALAALVPACGKDDTGSNNGGSNNGTSGSNNGSNGSNDGSNNGTDGGSNNGGSNNGTNGGTTGTTGSNNGTNGGSNNGTNGGTNNGTNGKIEVTATIDPVVLSEGDDFTVTLDVTNLVLDTGNYGGTAIPGHGHYHVYFDMVDADHELLGTAENPATGTLALDNVEITTGDHDFLVVVHRNDHTEFDQPIQIDIPVTVK